MKDIIKALFSLAFVAVYFPLVGGFQLYKMWQWFVLSPFPDAPHFTYLQSVGFVFVLSIVKSGGGQSIKDEYRDREYETSTRIVTPWVFLLIAYCFHLAIN